VRDLGVCVHIGGTNGKGSCAAFVESIARCSGLRTALFTSPHLERFAERMQVGGRPLDEELILAAYERMREVVASYAADDQPSFFEQITIVGLHLLAQARPELSVIEVGLGGRLDATNVIRAEVACVTGVALDHQDVLGNDLQEIAREKAGIFKAGQRVVIGCSGLAEAVPTLIEAAERAGVASSTVVRRPLADSSPLGLAGSYQRANAAAALAVVAELQALKVLPVDPQLVAAGLARTRHPGRIEQVGARPRVILDGAHNPHGAAALAVEMAAWPGPRVLVVGVSGDKDLAGILEPLRAAADLVIATSGSHPRLRPAAEVAAGIRGRDGLVVDDLAVALELAKQRAGSDGTVVVAGSLFLVGEARQLVRLAGRGLSHAHA
ncbi:MAG: bifunctional folylpolyglutamate synthase/dihydrofolate synthase, partial [Myxococcales bacterium]|nr:bifunctional folylpolyglutamate synthase/dihydrofolate synthase [Myxococcales bacterium]